MPDQKVSLNHKIPARYIGTHQVRLVGSLGPYFDTDGNRKEDLILSYGDTLMMPAAEVLGYTQLRQGERLLVLGLGKVVLPEDKDKSEEELIDYTFHMGRADFEPITLPVATSSTSAASTQEVQVKEQAATASAEPTDAPTREKEN